MIWGYEEAEWDSEYDSTWEDDEDYKPSKSKKAKCSGSRAAADLQRYRHGYPDPMPNLRFYRNETPFIPSGIYIEDFFKYWKNDYRELEHNHNYIQWLFPLREPGMNPSARPLTKKEIKEMKNDEVVMKRFLESYKLMLGFYGIELVDSKTGQLDRAKNWQARFSNLNAKTHNNLRITRILKCLGELGYEHFQVPLVKFFLKETLCNGKLQNVQSSALDYFMFTVKNRSERKELVLYAWEHFKPQEKFKWGPMETLKKLRPPAASTVEQKNMGAQKNGYKEDRGSTMEFRPEEATANEGSTTNLGPEENKENEEQSKMVRLENKKTEVSNMESELHEEKQIGETQIKNELGEGRRSGEVPVDSKSEDDKENGVPLMESGSRHDKKNGEALTGPSSRDDNEKKDRLNGQSPTESRSGGNKEKEELPKEFVFENKKEKEGSVSKLEEDKENKRLLTETNLVEDQLNGGQSMECGLGDEKDHGMQQVQSVLGEIKEKNNSLIKSGLRDAKENEGAQIPTNSGKSKEYEGSLLKFGENEENGGQPIDCGLGVEKENISTPMDSCQVPGLEDEQENRRAPSQLNSGDGTENGKSPMESKLTEQSPTELWSRLQENEEPPKEPRLTENKDSDDSSSRSGLDKENGGSLSEDGSTSDRNNEQTPTELWSRPQENKEPPKEPRLTVHKDREASSSRSGLDKENGGSLSEEGSTSDKNNEQSPIESGSRGTQKNEEPPMDSVLENNKEREELIIKTGSGEDTEDRGTITESVHVKDNEKPLTQSELEDKNNGRSNN